MARRKGAALAFAAVLVITLGACSDDDDDASGDAEVAADEVRYCELTAEVEAQAEETFSGLGEDANEEQVTAAQAQLLEDVDDELDEMVDVAPPEIADDVEAYVAFFRAQMRNEETEQVSDARILAWEEANCPGNTQ